MGKKILSLCISMILIMLHGCGSEMNVGNSSSKLTTSKLKGDFVFYVKDNSIYYTNCDDIVETKLIDYGVKGVIYLDEKRKNIIYVQENDYGDDKIYIKPIKSDSETITIDSASVVLPIINNRYIVYKNDGLFCYDLDSKKKQG